MKQLYRKEDLADALELVYELEVLQQQFISAIYQHDMAEASEIVTRQANIIGEIKRLQSVYHQHKKLVQIVESMANLGVEMEVVIRETTK